MKNRVFSLLVLILITVLVLGVAALLLIPDTVTAVWQQANLPPAPLQQVQTWLGQVTGAEEVRLYGTLEARPVHVMSEVGGRAVAVLVDEGDAVDAGQVLIRLDPTDAQAQEAAAREAVTAAERARDAVAAPPDETTRQLADRAVAAARTDVRNAERSLAQAEDMLAHPLAIESQINQTLALIRVANTGIDAAEASVKQVQVLIDAAKTDGSLQGKYQVQSLQAQKDAAEETLHAAEIRRTGLYRTLALLRKMKAEPIALETNVHQAQSQLALAQAALRVAEAERAATIASPQPEKVAVAAADVQKAQAALALVQWQAQHLEITAPIAGQVQAKLVESGELVQPGQPLLSLWQPQQLEVWAYVAQQDLHRVHLGDWLPVEVIAIPGQTYQAQVSFIAHEAQFRPNNVLNPGDRGDMVFLIKLQLQNEEGRLKPGMPVDIVLP